MASGVWEFPVSLSLSRALSALLVKEYVQYETFGYSNFTKFLNFAKVRQLFTGTLQSSCSKNFPQVNLKTPLMESKWFFSEEIFYREVTGYYLSFSLPSVSLIFLVWHRKSILEIIDNILRLKIYLDSIKTLFFLSHGKNYQLSKYLKLSEKLPKFIATAKVLSSLKIKNFKTKDISKTTRRKYLLFKHK